MVAGVSACPAEAIAMTLERAALTKYLIESTCVQALSCCAPDVSQIAECRNDQLCTQGTICVLIE